MLLQVPMVAAVVVSVAAATAVVVAAEEEEGVGVVERLSELVPARVAVAV